MSAQSLQTRQASAAALKDASALQEAVNDRVGGIERVEASKQRDIASALDQASAAMAAVGRHTRQLADIADGLGAARARVTEVDSKWVACVCRVV